MACLCNLVEHDNRCLTKKRLREGSMVDVHTPLDVDAGCTSSVNSMGDDSVTVPSEQCINSLVAKKRTKPQACEYHPFFRNQRDDATFFNHGWQKFVKDHSLEETDLLVFRYNGWSQFGVLIFDGKNLCE